MGGKRTLDVLLGTVLAGACWFLVATTLAAAGVEDSRFEISPDGASVEFDIRDMSRRDVLNHLFAGSDLQINWSNATFAEGRIRGKFTGTPAAVVRQLLAQTNFVIVRDGSNEESRVVRLVVVGPAQGEQSSAGLAALSGAVKPVKPKEPSKAQSVGGAPTRPEPARPESKEQRADAAPTTAEGSSPLLTGARSTSSRSGAHPTQTAAVLALSDVGRGNDATGLLKPPPKGATPPMLVSKGGAETPALVPPSQLKTEMPLTGNTAPSSGPAQAPRDKN